MVTARSAAGLMSVAVLLTTMVILRPAGGQSDDTARQLHAMFDEQWEYHLREDPIEASYLGDRRYNARWPDVSLTAIRRRHEHDRAVLDKLDTLDLDPLSKQDRLNYTLFRKDYATKLEGHPYRWYLLPLNQRGGVQTANEVADAIPFETVKDYEDWIARLTAFPAYVDQMIALMRQGIRVGMVHAKVVMQRVPDQIEAQIVGDPTDSPFFKPLRHFPGSVSGADRRQLTLAAKEAISESVIPSFRKLLGFFMNDYLPACTPRAGAWQLPSGKAMYAYRARMFTTSDLTPGEIHEIGQQEVRRIRAKMEKIIAEVGFEGSFDEFLEFLRTDPRFYYDDPNDLLEGYQALAKRLDPTLVKLFGKLPRVPYGVEPIPDLIAPDTTTAYYMPPAADGSRAGIYYVNLYRPEVRPKFEMEVLSMHESVPGHHLQIALAMELDNLPKFRRYGGGYTAFVEGWGLYSESLGGELGFYRDPYSKFGQLTYEMWRAVRLVVDTGIHYFAWPRQRAIDFFKANAAKTEHDITNEIDRYISWPGQAMAYKIGELKIKELRARATQELGEEFDIRQFHDVVLSGGAVPLDVLETIVDAWIEDQKR